MKTLALLTLFVVMLAASKAGAQTAATDWSIDIHASPYLFQGQVEKNSWYYDYSYDTFVGFDLTRTINRYVGLSASFAYTKARANFRPIVTLMETAGSTIPNNSFLTESFDSYIRVVFSPMSSGVLQPQVSTGLGLAYFAHESKGPTPYYYGVDFLPVPYAYQAQRVWVPFVPVEAGMLFNLFQIGDFRLGADARVLAMFSLRKALYLDGAGKLTQPISTGVLTGLSVGW